MNHQLEIISGTNGIMTAVCTCGEKIHTRYPNRRKPGMSIEEFTGEAKEKYKMHLHFVYSKGVLNAWAVAFNKSNNKYQETDSMEQINGCKLNENGMHNYQPFGMENVYCTQCGETKVVGGHNEMERNGELDGALLRIEYLKRDAIARNEVNENLCKTIDDLREIIRNFETDRQDFIGNEVKKNIEIRELKNQILHDSETVHLLIYTDPDSFEYIAHSVHKSIDKAKSTANEVMKARKTSSLIYEIKTFPVDQ